MYRPFMKALSALTIGGAALFLGGSPITAAIQAADNSGTSKAANAAGTFQGADQAQDARSHSGNGKCGKFCAGGGGNLTPQDQNLRQKAKTGQHALSLAKARQHGLNHSSPINVDGKSKHKGQSVGSWGSWGWGGASQAGFNTAGSNARNSAITDQYASQGQWAESSSGNRGCWQYCAGGGGNLTPQSQNLGQHANTEQSAASLAVANQKNLNVNSPVSVGGKSKAGGGSGSSAEQLGFNDANSWAKNRSTTKQDAEQGETASSSSGNKGCEKYCTGGGGNITPQTQDLNQTANTSQSAESLGVANQQLLNVNIPITIVGWGSVGTSGGSATQVAENAASSSARNSAVTEQGASQGQEASSSSGNKGCEKYCTGGGGNITPQTQNLNQSANTSQQALSAALANQKVMNVNIPITIVGWGSVGTAGGSANQVASNSAGSTASNAAVTTQYASQGQQASSSSGNSGCTAYCTGGGGNITPQSQSLGQHAGTYQDATSLGSANQGASNTSSPVTTG